MPACIVCGENTQLMVGGVPICLKCDGASAEVLRQRRLNKPPASEKQQAQEKSKNCG
jgi:hypothetical protein